MLCGTERLWAQAYAALKRDALGDTDARALGQLQTHVTVFVATDSADSVATLAILERVFSADGVQYSVVPVSGYEDLMRAGRNAGLSRTAVRSLVLINCGGTEDVVSMLELGPHARAFVFDSHRPLHLNNVDPENTQVVCVARAGQEQRAERAIAHGILHTGGTDDEDEGDSDLDAEEEEEEEDEEGGGPGPSGGEDEGVDGDGRRVRRRTEGAAGGAGRREQRERRELRRERQRQVIEYYSQGSAFGEASGCLLFDWARALSPRVRGDDHLLWCAIVALTDHYIHQRESHAAYTEKVMQYEQYVAEASSTAIAGRHQAVDSAGTTAVINVGARRIQVKQDFHIIMLRHWSLLEAMLHSPYVVTRIRTWREKGRDNIKGLLARMGFPLRDSQQPWSQMNPRKKRELAEKLDEFAPQFNLAELRFASFQLDDGYRVCMSATDHVHALTALLEIGSSSLDSDSSSVEHFWEASKALNSRGSEVLEKGVDRAKQLQRAIIQLGCTHIQNKNVTRAPRFRCLDLSSASDSGALADAQLLSHSLVLERLALFLLEAFVQMGKSGDPVVVVGPDTAGSSVVVAVTGAPHVGHTKNPFSIKFRKAAEECQAAFQAAGFNSCVIEVNTEDVPRFLDELTLDEAY